MFGSAKYKKSSSEDRPQNIAQLPEIAIKDDIYVMPEKFHPQKADRSANKALVIVIVILILVVAASATYFLYDMWQKNQDQQLADAVNANTNANINTNVNTNINANRNRNANGNSNVNTNENENVNFNENNNENTNFNANENENINTNSQSNPPVVSGDADNDGLTDLEENVLGSSLTRPDTDSDGYLDGNEVINGYNPLIAGSDDAAKILAADFIESLTTNFSQDNFEILYPKSWQANVLGSISEARIMAETGEIIRLSVIDNQDQVSIANWYVQNNPQTLLSQMRSIAVGDLEGYFSPNGLEVYLTDLAKTKIYIFKYVMDEESEFRYPAIFRMIINSFKLLAAISLPDLGDNNAFSTATST